MKLNKKLLFGMGSILVPISVVTVAVSCTGTSQNKTTKINDELARVTLDLANKEKTLASDVSTSSKFTTGGFDTEKYNLKFVSVTVGDDKKSVSVTIQLEEKTTDTKKLESNTRKIEITGFQTPTSKTSSDPSRVLSNESKEVELKFTDAANTLVKDVNASSNFNPTGFDTSKYDFEIVSVGPGEDKTTVLVIYRLKTKGTTPALESEPRVKIIQGFKNPNIAKPPVVIPPTNPPGGGTAKVKTEAEQIADITNKLKSLIQEKTKDLKLSDIITFTGDMKNPASDLQKISNANAKLDFGANSLSIKVDNKEILKFNFNFLGILKAVPESSETDNNNINKLLSDVFASKLNSIDNLVNSKEFTAIISSLGNLVQFDTDWKASLNKFMDLSQFEFKLDFDKNTLSIKADDNTFKELVKFNVNLSKSIKELLKSLVQDLVKKPIDKKPVGEANNEASSTESTASSSITTAINSAFDSLWSGVWEIKKADGKTLEFTRPVKAPEPPAVVPTVPGTPTAGKPSDKEPKAPATGTTPETKPKTPGTATTSDKDKKPKAPSTTPPAGTTPKETAKPTVPKVGEKPKPADTPVVVSNPKETVTPITPTPSDKPKPKEKEKEIPKVKPATGSAAETAAKPKPEMKPKEEKPGNPKAAPTETATPKPQPKPKTKNEPKVTTPASATTPKEAKPASNPTVKPKP